MSDHDRDSLRALLPFAVGGVEIMLVPNKRHGAEPTVLVMVSRGTRLLRKQLTVAAVRRLAAYLNVAADEAQTLAMLERFNCVTDLGARSCAASL